MSGENALSVGAWLALREALLKLPDSQFKRLVFALNPPPGILPSHLAAQGDRAIVLPQWVENSGPGLAVLQRALAQIAGPEIASPAPPPVRCLRVLLPGTSLTLLSIAVVFLRFYDEQDFRCLGYLI